MPKRILQPDWALPDNVGAAFTTRQFGNVAAHVNDDPAGVVVRRRRLIRELAIARPVAYLAQQHTRIVSTWPVIQTPSDGIIADQPGAACAVLTADCLPLLLCSRDGQQIAAVHAGWRGLASGILSRAVAQMPTSPAQLMLWIGPAICQNCFQVGDDVRDSFLTALGDVAVNRHFSADQDRWRADLPGLAEHQARVLGIASITQSGLCTSCRSDQFYSYRRHKDSGRFASIIWRKS